MQLVSKREKCIQFVEKHTEYFRCPTCHGQMELYNRQSLRCTNNHQFDIAKKGYIHLLNQQTQTKYDKDLFVARRRVMGGDFFEPVLEKIAEITNESMGKKVVLDAGCGEGSHLAKLQEKLTGNVIGFGADIAKEGIQSATSLPSETAWIVADLANCPLADGQFNYIYNILSPSNYYEFQRLLTNNGLLIKVIPNSAYLQELRELFHKDKEDYDNEQTKALFRDKFTLLRTETVKYKVVMKQPLLNDLIQMTPLSWSANDEKLAKAMALQEQTITVDVTILVGQK